MWNFTHRLSDISYSNAANKAWITKYIHSGLCGEVTHARVSVNVERVKRLRIWMIKLRDVRTYSFLNLRQTTLAEEAPLPGLYSWSSKTSYRQISRSLEAARFGFKLFYSLWNLIGTSVAPQPRCLSNCRAIRSLWHPISRLRDFASFGGKTSYRLVNTGPEYI